MTKAKMTAAERKAAMELEFERLKERADFIDRVLQGDPGAWMHVKTILQDAQHIGSIELDKPIAEARQTALAMARIFQVLNPPAKEAPVKKDEPDDPLSRMEKAQGNVIPLRSTGTV